MVCRKCKKEIPDESAFCLYCGAKQLVNVTHRVKSRGNGTGTVYQLPNKKWKAEVVVGYYHENGKLKKRRRTGTFDKKKDAIAALSTLRGAEPAQKIPTMHDMYSNFTNTKKYDKLSKSQKDKLRFAWDKIYSIQLTKISDLSVQLMQDTIDETTNSFYPARDIKVLLSHLYDLAIKHGVEHSNKSKYIELPDAPKAKRQVFSEEDLAKFWDDYNGQCPDGPAEQHDFTGYILIMIYTGMRIGELFGIKKDNVHLNDHYMIGGEKSAAGRDREIPINNLIFPIVQKFLQHSKRKLVERNLDGFYDDYWETIQRLEIKNYPPQTCRHTYFTLLAERKVHPSLIAAMGGHAQYQTAIDNYNRLPLQSKIDAANTL